MIATILESFALGLVFFLVVTPIALFSRLLGRDSLGLRRRTGQTTYWIERKHGRLLAKDFQKQAVSE